MIPSTTIHTHTVRTTTIHINITIWMERVIVTGDRIIAVLKMDGPHVVMMTLRIVHTKDQCVMLTDWMERVIVPGDRIIAVLKMDGPHVVMISLRNVQKKEKCVIVLLIKCTKIALGTQMMIPSTTTIHTTTTFHINMTEIWGRVIVPGDRIIAVLKMDGPHVVVMILRIVHAKDQCVMMTEIWGRVFVPMARIINAIKMGGRHVVRISLKNVQNKDHCVMIMDFILLAGGKR